MIKILKGFRHAEQFFASNAGKEKALLATNPTDEQIADWQKRGLISGAVDAVENAGTALLGSLRNQADEMLREILDILEKEVEDGESPIEVLRRIVGERDAFSDEISKLQSQLESKLPESGQASPSSSSDGGNAPQDNAGSTPKPEITASELSEALNAKVAMALVTAGFDTREKVRAATDDQLRAVEGLGDVLLGKLREITK